MAGFILPVVSGLAGLFGGLKPKVTTTTGNTNSTGQSVNNQNTTTGSQGTSAGQTAGSQTATNVHNLSPFQQALADRFTQGALDSANSSTDLSGYTNNGLQAINDASGARTTALKNVLASRGLSYSPAAANAEVGDQQNRLNQQSSFLQGVPLLQRQLQDKAQAGLISAFGALPTDTTQSGTSEGTSSGTFNTNGFTDTKGETDTKGSSNSTSQSNTPGNPIAGLLGGLGGAIGQQGSDPGGIIDIISKLFGG